MSEDNCTDSDVDIELMISEKILFILTLYPRLSPSMLQVALGTALSPKIWKRSLVQLIALGKIVQVQEMHKTSIGRMQSFTFLQLPTYNQNVLPSLQETTKQAEFVEAN